MTKTKKQQHHSRSKSLNNYYTNDLLSNLSHSRDKVCTLECLIIEALQIEGSNCFLSPKSLYSFGMLWLGRHFQSRPLLEDHEEQKKRLKRRLGSIIGCLPRRGAKYPCSIQIELPCPGNQPWIWWNKEKSPSDECHSNLRTTEAGRKHFPRLFPDRLEPTVTPFSMRLQARLRRRANWIQFGGPRGFTNPGHHPQLWKVTVTLPCHDAVNAHQNPAPVDFRKNATISMSTAWCSTWCMLGWFHFRWSQEFKPINHMNTLGFLGVASW